MQRWCHVTSKAATKKAPGSLLGQGNVEALSHLVRSPAAWKAPCWWDHRRSLHPEMPEDPQLFKPKCLSLSRPGPGAWVKHLCDGPIHSYHLTAYSYKPKRRKYLRELLPNHWLIKVVRETGFQAIQFWSNLLLHSYWNSTVYKSVWKAGYDLYNNRSHARIQTVFPFGLPMEVLYMFAFC